MKINIKNARRLETSIDDEILRIRNKIQYPVGSYTSKSDAVEATLTNIQTSLDKITDLRFIRKSIRDSIGLFNSEMNINSITSEIADKSSELDILESISKIPNSKSEHRFHSNETETFSSGIGEDHRENFYSQSLKLKRAIQRLKDKCQGINASGTIELTAAQESFLKVNGLMD